MCKPKRNVYQRIMNELDEAGEAGTTVNDIVRALRNQFGSGEVRAAWQEVLQYSKRDDDDIEGRVECVNPTAIARRKRYKLVIL